MEIMFIKNLKKIKWIEVPILKQNLFKIGNTVVGNIRSKINFTSYKSTIALKVTPTLPILSILYDFFVYSSIFNILKIDFQNNWCCITFYFISVIILAK